MTQADVEGWQNFAKVLSMMGPFIGAIVIGSIVLAIPMGMVASIWLDLREKNLNLKQEELEYEQDPYEWNLKRKQDGCEQQ